MSEWHPQVVRIGKTRKHPNADTLSITHVLGNYPVIFRTGEYEDGDLAAYIPVDTMVPNEEPFTFLFEGKLKERARLKAKKLRGIFSMGLLVPLPEDGYIVYNRQEDETMVVPAREGDSVVRHFRLEKFDPEEKLHMGNAIIGPKPPCDVPKYDLEGLRANSGIFDKGELVIITEKIHGANARFMWWGEKLWVGSRSRWLDPDHANVWAELARRYDLAASLMELPGIVVFGEVYGKVQELRYGLCNKTDLVLFDAYDATCGRWVGRDMLIHIAFMTGVPLAPLVYTGPYLEDLAYELAEGPSTLCGDHPREGVVIEPLVPRWDDRVGRVKLKLVGEGYMTHKKS